jgi:hypothetical protein
MTIYCGGAETRQFSAYAACRKEAGTTKGYGVWEHDGTSQQLFLSTISFSDGCNPLSCVAVGVGPFWTVISTWQTLMSCGRVLDSGETISLEGYYGVNP